MKKRSIYYIFILFFLAAIIFIIAKYNKGQKEKETTTYALLERKGPLGKTEDWDKIRSRANALQYILQKNPKDTKSALDLTLIYIQEARITGNFVYYDVAAMKYVDDVLKIDSANFEAVLYKALLYLSQHHFADGLAMAQKARNMNPYNAYVYGMLVDGNVEMGYYDSAVANSDKMVSIRPDLRSYSRISYLREIYGDYPGAISAMKMAVDAGAPGDESTEWTRIQLGHLYERTGDLKNAEMQYAISLEERPGYAYGLAGLARIQLSRNNYDTAIQYYIQADSLVNDFSFKEELVEAYELAGQKAKADSLAKVVVTGLTNDAAQGQNDENIGHYADRELAYAYIKINELDKALEHALLEYNRRPDNIDVNETVAWVYFKKSDYVNAKKYIDVALKTKSKNPVLLSRAGLIYNGAGDKAMAKSFLQQAMAAKPNISRELVEESMKTMSAL